MEGESSGLPGEFSPIVLQNLKESRQFRLLLTTDNIGDNWNVLSKWIHSNVIIPFNTFIKNILLSTNWTDNTAFIERYNNIIEILRYPLKKDLTFKEWNININNEYDPYDGYYLGNLDPTEWKVFLDQLRILIYLIALFPVLNDNLSNATLDDNVLLKNVDSFIDQTTVVVPYQPIRIIRSDVPYIVKYNVDDIELYLSINSNIKMYKKYGEIINRTDFIWKEKSSWIDNSLGLLFRLPGSPIEIYFEQVLIGKIDNGVLVSGLKFEYSDVDDDDWSFKYFNKKCTKPFINAILKDIKVIQTPESKRRICLSHKLWGKCTFTRMKKKTPQNVLSTLHRFIQLPEDDYLFLVDTGSYNKGVDFFKTVLIKNTTKNTWLFKQKIGYFNDTAKVIIVSQQYSALGFFKKTKNNRLIHTRLDQPKGIDAKNVIIDPYGDLNKDVYTLVGGIVKSDNNNHFISYIYDISSTIWWRFDSSRGTGRRLLITELDTVGLPRIFSRGAFWYKQKNRPFEMPILLQFYHVNEVQRIRGIVSTEARDLSRYMYNMSLKKQRQLYNAKKIQNTDRINELTKELEKDYNESLGDRKKRMKRLISKQKDDSLVKKFEKLTITLTKGGPSEFIKKFDAKTDLEKWGDSDSDELIRLFPVIGGWVPEARKRWWKLYLKGNNRNWPKGYKKELSLDVKRVFKTLKYPKWADAFMKIRIPSLKTLRPWVYAMSLLNQPGDITDDLEDTINVKRAIAYVMYTQAKRI
jgi:hypothetical protein